MPHEAMTAGQTIASFWPKQLPLCEFGVDAACWDDTHTNREATAQVSSLHSSVADATWIKSP
jgi:hypothetical protein